MIVLITLVLCLVSAPFIWWYMFVLQKFKSLKVIPGPQPLPIIGNMSEIGSSPEDVYDNLVKLSKEYGDLFKLYVGSELKVFIARPELLEALLSSNEHITKSDGYDLFTPWLGDGILISTGKKWKSRRKLITPTFHFKILEQFVQIFNSCGDILVQKLVPEVGKKTTDIYPYINLCSFDIICQTSMGITHSFQEGNDKEYVQTVRSFLDIVMTRFFSAWQRIEWIFQIFASNSKQHNSFIKFLNVFADKTIQKRREEKSFQGIKTVSDDGIRKKLALIDTLLASEENYNLSNEDIRDEINTFLFEGHDTTSSGIAFTLLALAEHSDIQEKVYEEIQNVIGDEKVVTMEHLQNMKYLDLVIKEGQRLYPSVPFVERRLQTNWSIAGYDFPKDTCLNVFIYGIHQNETYYPQPEKFRPERFLPENQSKRHIYSYIPFSAGPRNCVGQKFAVLGMKTVIIKILKNFRLTAVPNYKPKIGTAAILKSYNGICVQLQNRI